MTNQSPEKRCGECFGTGKMTLTQAHLDIIIERRNRGETDDLRCPACTPSPASTITITTATPNGTMYHRVCTCGQKCLVHEDPSPASTGGERWRPGEGTCAFHNRPAGDSACIECHNEEMKLRGSTMFTPSKTNEHQGKCFCHDCYAPTPPSTEEAGKGCWCEFPNCTPESHDTHKIRLSINPCHDRSPTEGEGKEPETNHLHDWEPMEWISGTRRIKQGYTDSEKYQKVSRIFCRTCLEKKNL